MDPGWVPNLVLDPDLVPDPVSDMVRFHFRFCFQICFPVIEPFKMMRSTFLTKVAISNSE
jgi:hypothetical protein